MRSGRQAHENRANRKLDMRSGSHYSNGMTIDERIERLTERHEALAQSVEILHRDVRELVSGIRELREAVSDTQGMIIGLAQGLGQTMRAVESHEQRLQRLEA